MPVIAHLSTGSSMCHFSRVPFAALAFLAAHAAYAADSTSLLDSAVPSSSATVQKTAQGITLSDKKGDDARLTTKAEFKVPLVITARVKTDSTNIRLYYGEKGMIILDWEL